MLRHRFLILLVLLGLLVVVHPVAMQGGPAHAALAGADHRCVRGGHLACLCHPPTRTIGLLLGVPVLLAHWANEKIPALTHPWIPFFFNLIAFLFLAYTVIVIMRAVYYESHHSREAIYGALCGFLLIGAAFGHLFYCADWLAPADFQEDPAVAVQVRTERHQAGPVHVFQLRGLDRHERSRSGARCAAGRSLVLIEAVLGQFYVIVVLSELISIRTARVAPAEPAERSPAIPPAHSA